MKQAVIKWLGQTSVLPMPDFETNDVGAHSSSTVCTPEHLADLPTGKPLSLLFTCWLYAFYCYDYQWALRGVQLPDRLEFFERSAPFFAGKPSEAFEGLRIRAAAIRA